MFIVDFPGLADSDVVNGPRICLRSGDRRELLQTSKLRDESKISITSCFNAGWEPLSSRLYRRDFSLWLVQYGKSDHVTY